MWPRPLPLSLPFGSLNPLFRVLFPAEVQAQEPLLLVLGPPQDRAPALSVAEAQFHRAHHHQAPHRHHFRGLQQGLERAGVQHRRPTSFLLPRPIHAHSSMALPLPMERPHLNRPQPLPSVLPPLPGLPNLLQKSP